MDWRPRLGGARRWIHATLPTDISGLLNKRQLICFKEVMQTTFSKFLSSGVERSTEGEGEEYVVNGYCKTFELHVRSTFRIGNANCSSEGG